MNNIQKSFKNKAKLGLRMAVGGVINESVDPQNQWGGGGGLVSMDHDPMADMNALDKVQTLSSQGNPFYTPGSRNDPHASSIQTTVNQGTKPATPYVEATRSRPLRNTMTPVEDLFPQKGLRLADGGVIADPVEALLARTKATYGAAPSQPAVEAPRPVAPQVTQPAPQAKGGLFDNALRGLRGRAAQIDKATGMAQGGTVVADGGRSKAPTADSVPVNLSHGEAVLPVKTVAAMGGPRAVENFIETTNGKPTATRGLRAGGHYGTGVVQYVPAVDDEFIARGENLPTTRAAPPQALPQPTVGTKVVPVSPVYEAGYGPANTWDVQRSTTPVQDGLRTRADPSKPNWTQPRNMPTAYTPPASSGQHIPGGQAGAAFDPSDVKARAQAARQASYAEMNSERARQAAASTTADARAAGAKPNVPNAPATPKLSKTAMLGRGLSAASAGFQGYTTGSDLNEVWQNDKTDMMTKIAATLQGAGDVAGNVLSRGILPSPVTAIASGASRLFGGDGTTSMNLALAGTTRDKAAQQVAQQVAAQPAATTQPAAPTQAQAQAQPAAAATPEQLAAQRDAQFAQASGVDPEIVKLAAGNENRTAGFGTLRDATQFAVPKGSGGGVITGAPDKQGLRRAMVVLPNGSPSQAQQSGGAQPVRDSYGNDMTRTNEMKKQLTDMRLENAITDMQSSHPFYQQRGLRTMAAMMPQQELAQKQAETTSLDGYRKGQLGVQNRQVDLQTALAEAQGLSARAKAADEGVVHGEKVLSESGVKDEADQQLLRDLVHFNYPQFYKMTKAQQYEMLPRIKGEVERLKKIRANTTNGLTSLRPGEVAKVDKLNYADDVVDDPDGFAIKKRIFGSDTDPTEMGAWNVWKRKNLPDFVAGTDTVYQLDDGTRVRPPGIRGAAGPLGNIDTRAIVDKQLKKHEKS